MAEPPRLRATRAELPLAVLLGLGAGLSSLANGLYDVSGWGPAGIAAAAVLVATLLARTAAISGRVLVVAGSMAALGVISLLSAHWADDRSGAFVDGSRWLVYATAVLAFGALTPGAEGRRSLGGSALAGVTIVAAYIELRLLIGHGETLFNGGRLLEPVGYANGQAALLLMGFWFAFAAAERARSPYVSAGAAALGALQLGLTILTQTRAAIPAAVLSVLVLMVIAPGRTRRGWLLVVSALGPLVAVSSALHVYDAPKLSSPPDSVTQPAGRAILLGALLTGIVWLIAELGRAAIIKRSTAHASRAASGVLVAVTVLGVVGALVAVGDPVSRVENAWNDFTSLRQPPPDQSRFASIGGNRYDYWRVAGRQWTSERVHGVGAGNYVQTYPQLRATSEYVQQPHSLELQVVSELGLAGLVGVVLLTVALGWCVAGALRPAGGTVTMAGLGGAGVLVTWFVQTSVDWLHLLPGVTGVALVAVVLCVPGQGRKRLHDLAGEGRVAVLRRAGSRVVPVAMALLAVITGVEATRITLADRYRTMARDQLAAGEPRAAITDVARSLRFDARSAQSYYARSAALALRNDYEGARDALLLVAAREPHNFLPQVLLGDLASLRRDRSAAVASYARARELNPQDPAMAANVERARLLPRN